jgi:hypothetical protein
MRVLVNLVRKVLTSAISSALASALMCPLAAGVKHSQSLRCSLLYQNFDNTAKRVSVHDPIYLLTDSNILRGLPFSQQLVAL